MGYFKAYQFQHALSVSLTILFGFLISFYLGNPIAYWITLIAFLVNPITCGTSLRQSLLALIIIIAALILSLFLVSLRLPIIYIFLVIVIFYFACGFLLYQQGSVNLTFSYQNFIFFFVFLIATLPLSIPKTTLPLPSLIADGIINMGDQVLAGIIGICCSQLFFPPKITKEFKLGLVPVLYAIRHYHDGVIKTFIRHEHNPLLLVGKRMQLENSLQSRHGHYPNWVYETGFNRGLRKGYRFFLINLEMLIEEIFALTSVTSEQLDATIISVLIPQINQVMQKNDELLSILIDFFSSEKMTTQQEDFMRDIIELENALRRIMPGNLELLDMMPDYITLVAFVQIIKDIRERLLQLVLAVS